MKTTLDDKIDKMERCSYLLEPPAGEVVRSLVAALVITLAQRDRLYEDVRNARGPAPRFPEDDKPGADAAILAVLDEESK